MITNDYFAMQPKSMSLQTRLRGPVKEDTGSPTHVEKCCFMRGELLRFSNKYDFSCDSQMVLPGGSDISSGDGFENNAV